MTNVCLSIFSVERKEAEFASLSAKDRGSDSALRGHRTETTSKMPETKFMTVLFEPSFTLSALGQHWIKTVAVTLLLQSSDTWFTHLFLHFLIFCIKENVQKISM